MRRSSDGVRVPSTLMSDRLYREPLLALLAIQTTTIMHTTTLPYLPKLETRDNASPLFWGDFFVQPAI